MTASKRRLSNIRLTREFHFRHMGLWVMITISLVLLANGLVYLLLLQQWGFAGGMAFEAPQEAARFRRVLGTVLGVETALFCVAVVYMARLTSHRIAGAFLALQKTCNRVSAGERDVRQHFRDYDHLTDLEKSFNRMLDTLTKPGP